MKKFISTIAILFFLTNAQAQTIIIRDPMIETMVNQVSADSLQSYVNTMVSFGTRHTLSASAKGKGIGAAREWVVSKFLSFAKRSGGRMTALVDTITLAADGKRVDAPTLLGNAVAILKGTDTSDKRVYVISGHLDSRVTDIMNRTSDAPGANDDASGVAAVIECARLMSTHSFPCTIIFVAVSGEEQSLLGSGFMAAKAAREKWKIDAMLNNDIVGSNNSSGTMITDNTKLRVFSESFAVSDTGRAALEIRRLGWENDSKSRQLARYAKETGERYVDNMEVVMIYRPDRFLRGGDQTPFLERNFAAVRFTEMNENFDHQHQDLRTEKGIEYGDLARFMDFEYLRKNTAVNLAVLSNLAKAPNAPVNVEIETRNLVNTSTLTWKSSQGGAAYYYVLIRETTGPYWQKKIKVEGTSITLPYSKDNFFFAVQAVSANGNESLPVLPRPAR